MLKSIKKIYNFFRLDNKQKRHQMVGRPEFWKMKQDFQINFVKNMGLNPSDSFLDVGCGTLRGGIPIIKYLDSGNYFGIEVRKEVLDEGKKELKEEGLEEKEPNLIHFTDFADIKVSRKFNFIFAFSVLIHLKDEILEDCLKFVSENLKKTGVFYANVNIGDVTLP